MPKFDLPKEKEGGKVSLEQIKDLPQRRDEKGGKQKCLQEKCLTQGER
jgi:hypothetical protein